MTSIGLSTMIRNGHAWLRKVAASIPGVAWIVDLAPLAGPRRAFDPRWRRSRALRLVLAGAASVSMVATAAFLSSPGDSASQDASDTATASVADREQIERTAVHGIAVSVRDRPETAAEEAPAAQPSPREARPSSHALASARPMQIANVAATAEPASADSTLRAAAQGTRVDVPSRPRPMGAGAHVEDDDGGGFFSNVNVTVSTGGGGQTCTVSY